MPHTNPVLCKLPEALESSRLVIRAPRAGDGLDVYEGVMESLDDLRAWPCSLPWAQSEPSADASETFVRTAAADFITRKNLNLLLFDKATGQFIGACGLHRLDWSVPKCEVGFWCRKPYQGQGLMTEALVAITELAFSKLGAKRVSSRTDATNLRSRAVLERAGYALEGTLRHNRRSADGRLWDTCVYAQVR